MDFKFKQEIVLVLIIAFYLFQQSYLISQLNQLPSPLYGGDYYFQLGSVTHIMEGGNPLVAPNIPNSEPGYFIVYSYLVASFGSTFGLEPMIAIFLFSQICIILFIVSLYLILSYITNNKNIALLSTILFLPLSAFPILKYTEFTSLFLFPIMFFSIYYFYKKQNILSSTILGIVAGILSISHGAAFFVSLSFITLMFLAFMFHRVLKIDIREKIIEFYPKRTNIKKYLPMMIIALVIAFSIALLWWYNPIFVHKGVTLNDNQNWAFEDLSRFDIQLVTIYRFLSAALLNFGSINLIIISILAIIGIYLIATQELNNKIFILMFITISVIITLHYLITQPLIKTNFSSGKAFEFLIPFSTILLTTISLEFLEKKITKYFFPLVIIVLLITTGFYYMDFNQRVQKDQWINVGKNPLSEDLIQTREWVLNNTSVDDIFLSTKELSFALNGLTGRKVMVSRRSQNSPFIDIDQLEADSAIILYGNDSSKRKELLDKYDVKYLYWSYYWIQSEYQINENGELVGSFDPIIVKDVKDYRNYLNKYNITFTVLNTWIDPAIKGPEIKKYNLLVVGPENYRDFNKPWNQGLDSYLEEAWNYTNNGKTYVKIYKVKQ
ncbi:MAG: hypothetical protein HY831_01435 [Candidatus Aenigmarchaeota archaeon]|nr:hypothetical protein [Candidatus Aenigmarchaeota archaeon]